MVKRQSPSVRRTQAERSESTRRALMDAGHRLFAERGYGGAAREAIVAEAGVTRGALQHHFGDKLGLFQAVYEEVEEQMVAAVAGAAMASAAEGALAMLRTGCQAYLEAVLDPAVQRICALDGPAVLPSDVRQAITDRYALDVVRHAVQEAMDNGEVTEGPVEPLSRVLLAGIVAAAQFVATAEDHHRARDQAGRTIDILLDSLALARP